MSVRVGVVGGGASGMVAALTAASKGAQVTLLELGSRLGRKVLASGGGRCNLGNARLDARRYHGGDHSFIQRVLSRFGTAETRRFFECAGLMLEEEPDGRIFPRTGQARSVVGVLEAALVRRGVKVLLSCEAAAIHPKGSGFSVETASRGPLEFDRLVVSCGGASYPQLGGGERGYALARGLGLGIVEPAPSLVPLLSRDAWVRKAAGLRAQAALTVRAGGRAAAESQGELLFTEYGISGPATLDVSREAVAALARGLPVECSINFFPDYEPRELAKAFRARWRALRPETLAAFLKGALADKIADAFLHSRGHGRVGAFTEDSAAEIAGVLSDWRLTIAGSRDWDEAMAVAGGVRLSEVSPDTMEARKHRGLHVTGELLDVDGDSGGFNLHFAWASGCLAGAAAAG